MTRFLPKAAIAGSALVLSLGAAQARGDCHGAACYRLVKTPPAFETVSQQVMVRPPQKIARHIPAEFDTVHETVVVQPARRVHIRRQPEPGQRPTRRIAAVGELAQHVVGLVEGDQHRSAESADAQG